MGNTIFPAITGFLLLIVHDSAQIRRKPLLKLLGYGGYPLIAWSYITIISAHTPHTGIPFWLLAALVVISVSAVLLLIYSVLIEIPLYIRTATIHEHTTSAERRTYDKGTYAISRHPGFIWMLILNIMLSLLYWEKEAILSLGTLTICNLLLIFLEDRFFFPVMFSDYESYKKKVPMLLANPFSKRNTYH